MPQHHESSKVMWKKRKQCQKRIQKNNPTTKAARKLKGASNLNEMQLVMGCPEMGMGNACPVHLATVARWCLSTVEWLCGLVDRTLAWWLGDLT